MQIKASNIPRLAKTLHEVAVENDPETRMLLPRGFSIRQVARGGARTVPDSDYISHADLDGGALFAIDGGGWV